MSFMSTACARGSLLRMGRVYQAQHRSGGSGTPALLGIGIVPPTAVQSLNPLPDGEGESGRGLGVGDPVPNP